MMVSLLSQGGVRQSNKMKISGTMKNMSRRQRMHNQLVRTVEPRRIIGSLSKQSWREIRKTKVKEDMSLTGDHGCLEFAKQFLIKKGQVNISPVSV